MLLPALTLDELRRRVREAEALIRVAKQHARDAHEDPSRSEHASARIQSICREIEELFPGLHDPPTPDPRMAETLAALHVEGSPAVGALADPEPGEGVDEDQDELEELGEEEDEDQEEEEEEQEWELDHAKLAAAIENEELMSRFPEPGRSAFKRAAQYLVEAHERQELLGRVVDGFGEISELAQQNVEDLRHKLAVALTLEQLATRTKG